MSAGGRCALSNPRRKQALTGSGPSGPGEGFLPTRDAPAALRRAELADSFIKNANLPFMPSQNGERMKMQLLVMPETGGGGVGAG